MTTRRSAGPWFDPTKVRKPAPVKPTSQKVFEGVTWFKKARYAGGNSRNADPIWHISAWPLKKGEIYKRYLAVCGYEIDQAILKDIQISYAKRTNSLPRAGWCKKCVKKVSEQ